MEKIIWSEQTKQILFTRNDFDFLCSEDYYGVKSYPFYDIYEEGSNRKVGRWDSLRNELTISKNKAFVSWLIKNSFIKPQGLNEVVEKLPFNTLRELIKDKLVFTLTYQPGKKVVFDAESSDIIGVYNIEDEEIDINPESKEHFEKIKKGNLNEGTYDLYFGNSKVVENKLEHKVQFMKDLVDNKFKDYNLKYINNYEDVYEIEVETDELDPDLEYNLELSKGKLIKKMNEFVNQFRKELSEQLNVINVTLQAYQFTKGNDRLKFVLKVLLGNTPKREWVNGRYNNPKIMGETKS